MNKPEHLELRAWRGGSETSEPPQDGSGAGEGAEFSAGEGGTAAPAAAGRWRSGEH